jgi:nucleotide-binding universal stress UspA family protein
VRILIATAGVLSPDRVARFLERLAGDDDEVQVVTVIEVPRSFLDEIRSDPWHPLGDGTPSWSSEEDASIARYVEERGHRITEPLITGLKAHGIEAEVHYLEGEDPAETIRAFADETRPELVVLGATKHLFEEWESVSARVLRDTELAVLVIPAAPRSEPEEPTE